MDSCTLKMNSLIAQAFYRHGIFCASRPLLMIFLTGITIFTCWLPLFTTPLYQPSQHPSVWKSNQTCTNSIPSSPSQDSQWFHQTYGVYPVFRVQHLFLSANSSSHPSFLSANSLPPDGVFY
eukprot:Sdes_comp13414_c0_seq1m3182